jgi:hypothetical protein
MKHSLVVAILAVLASLATGSPAATAGQKLSVRVSPAVAMAPAMLTVKATVEPSDRNRVLMIEIDSATYHSHSELPLDGRSAPRLNVVELKDVPTGLHEVRATLVGANGPIASSMQLVKVEASAGSSR